MSFTICTDVFCDKCSHWENGHTGPRPDRAKALKAVRSRGWTARPGKQLCPMCNGRASYRYNDGSYLWHSFSDKPATEPATPEGTPE